MISQLLTLKNGLKVQLCQKDNLNIGVIELVIGAGTIYENKANNGISHLLEHLLFEGTKSYPSRELFSDYTEKIGFEFLAYTYIEFINIYASFPMEKILIMLDLLKEMIFFPTLLESSLVKEKKIILDEINEDAYSDSERFQRIFFANKIYRNFFIGLPIAGSKKNVKSLSAEDLKAWHKKMFYPANMSLVITGDLYNIKNLNQVIQDIDDSMPATEFKAQFNYLTPIFPIQSKYRIIMDKPKDNKEKIIDFQLNTQSYLSDKPDKIKLDVIEQMMNFYLYKELRQKLNLTYSASLDSDHYNQMQTWHLKVIGDYQKIKKIIVYIFEIILQVRQANFSIEIFNTIKEQVLFDFYKLFSDYEGLSFFIAKNNFFNEMIDMAQIKSIINNMDIIEFKKLFNQVFCLNNYNFIFYGNLSIKQKKEISMIIKKNFS